MNSLIFRLVDQSRNALATSLFTQLRNSSTPHYATADPDVLERRCHELVRSFRDAVETEPARFADDICRITGVRIGEGYRLEEIQFALGIFEDLLWRMCVDKVSERDPLLGCLCLVSGTIDAAKDRLAREYLRYEVEALASAEALIYQLEELYKGTEALVLPID